MMNNNVTLKSKILDNNWFNCLIKRRLSEINKSDDEYLKQLEKSAIFSAIDYRMKYLHSMKNQTALFDELMDICSENGFIPQFEVSGAPVFGIGRVTLSPDSVFTINSSSVFTFDRLKRFMCLILTSNMLAYVRIPTETGLFKHEFSPHSDKVIIYNDDKDGVSFFVWSISDLKILYHKKIDGDSISHTSWSGNEKRLAIGFESGKILLIDLNTHPCSEIEIEIENFNDAIHNLHLNDEGDELLLLGKRANLIEINEVRPLHEYDLPCSSTSQKTYAIYLNGAFNVLHNGCVLKIDKESLELLSDHRDKIGEELHEFESLSHPRVSNFHVDDDYICLSLYYHASITYHDRIHSYKFSIQDLKHIESESRFGQSILPENDDEKIVECLENYIERRSQTIWRPSYEEERFSLGDEIYTTGRKSIVGFKLVDRGSDFSKYVYRQYIFKNGPPLHYEPFLEVSPDLMSSYDEIPMKCDFDEWSTDVVEDAECTTNILNDRRTTYFVELDPIIIDDTEKFDFISDQTLSRMRDWKTCNNNDEFFHYARGYLYKLNKNSLTFIKIPNEIQVFADDEDKIYTQKNESLPLTDVYTSDAQEIALPYRTPISKIFSDEENILIIIGKSTYFWNVGISSVKKIDGLDLSNNEICFEGGKIVYIENDRSLSPSSLCVYDINTHEKKSIRLPYDDLWIVLGASAEGNVSLIKSIENSTHLEFGRIDLSTGIFKQFEGLTAEHSGDFRDIDFKDSTVISAKYSPKQWIGRYSITKDGLKQSPNAITPNATKLSTNIVSLDNENYVIATTEPDKDDSDKNNKGFRSEIRLMVPQTGKKVKHKGLEHSEGLMYGPPNFTITEKSPAYSLLSGKYVAFESSYADQSIVNSWDTITGHRYPKNENEIISGSILEKIDDSHIKIGLSEGSGMIKKTAVFNHKMIQQKDSEIDLCVPFQVRESTIQYNTKINHLDVKKYGAANAYIGSGIELSDLKENDVIIIHNKEISREYGLTPPCICYNQYFNPPGSVSHKDAWSKINISLFTLKEGRLCNRLDTTVDVAFREYSGNEFEIRDMMQDLIISSCGEKYIIQQLFKKHKGDVREQIHYQIRIVESNNEDFIINDVLGPSHYHCGADEKCPVVSINRKSFSYTQKRDGKIIHVLHNDDENIEFEICDSDKYMPYSAYADTKLSITMDNFNNIIITDRNNNSKIHKPTVRVSRNIELLGGTADCKYFTTEYEKFKVTSDLEIKNIDDGELDGEVFLNSGKLINDTGVFILEKH